MYELVQCMVVQRRKRVGPSPGFDESPPHMEPSPF